MRHSQTAVCFSPSILAELTDVLGRKQFQKYVDDIDVRRFAPALVRESEWVQVNTVVTACRDPNDNKILALAVDGRANVIVTGDQDLLCLHPFRGIEIERPDQFVKRFPFNQKRP